MNLVENFKPTLLEQATVAGVTDFRGGFDNFWSTITDSMPGLETFMNIIGIILVLFAVISYLWQHRKGSNWGGGTNVMVGAAVFGAVMMAPGILLPLILGVVDWLVAFFYDLFSDPLEE